MSSKAGSTGLSQRAVEVTEKMMGGTEGPDSNVKQKVSCMKMRQGEDERMALRSGLVNVVDNRAMHRKRKHRGLTSFGMLWLKYPGTQNRWLLYG